MWSSISNANVYSCRFSDACKSFENGTFWIDYICSWFLCISTKIPQIESLSTLSHDISHNESPEPLQFISFKHNRITTRRSVKTLSTETWKYKNISPYTNLDLTNVSPQTNLLRPFGTVVSSCQANVAGENIVVPNVCAAPLILRKFYQEFWQSTSKVDSYTSQSVSIVGFSEKAGYSLIITSNHEYFADKLQPSSKCYNPKPEGKSLQITG